MELNNKSDVDQLSGEELREQAVALGIQFADNAQDKTIRKKIMDSLGIVDEDLAPSQSKLENSAPERPFSKQVTIIISRDKDDKQPVAVGVNGRVFRMKRGVEVTVPVEVLSVLDDAIQVTMELVEDEHGIEQMVASEVPAYNYRVVSK
mgnify:CR=1 FL=1